MFDWGDGNNSGWLGPITLGIAYKSWNSSGEYMLRLKAKDIYGYETPWSDPFTLTIAPLGNQPPKTPSIQGETNGKVGKPYEYTFVTTDPDGDDVYYCINWSDGTGEVCIGPYASGEEVKTTHTWSEKGTYIIRVKAEDVYGAESDWGTLSVKMPCSYNIPFLQFWERLFERFPHIFPILRYLLGQ